MESISQKATFNNNLMKVIRIIDQYCLYNEYDWIMHGDLLRKLFSSLPDKRIEECPMEVYIKSTNNVAILILCKNLEITGFKCIYKDAMKAELQYDSPEGISLRVFLKQNFPITQFAEDDIVLTNSGFTVFKMNNVTDNLNISKGLCTFERILNLSNNHLTTTSYFLQNNTIFTHKYHNTELLQGELKAQDDGFSTSGSNMKIERFSDSCPICYEDNYIGTRLKCGHIFCLKCISQILSISEHQSPRCSICRKGLAFNV
jgi:hypothetical protein